MWLSCPVQYAQSIENFLHMLMQVQQQLNVSAESLQLSDSLLKKSYALGSILPPGHHINKPEVLFRNITEEEVEQLRSRCAEIALVFTT